MRLASSSPVTTAAIEPAMEQRPPLLLRQHSRLLHLIDLDKREILAYAYNEETVSLWIENGVFNNLIDGLSDKCLQPSRLDRTPWR
jgi:hypothetical protein